MRCSIIIFGLVSASLLGACTGTELLLFDVASTVILTPGNAGQSDFGSVQFVSEGETVEMESDAVRHSNSGDFDYEWRQTNGPAISLSILRTGTARFVAPSVKHDREQLNFHVRVETDTGSVHERTFAVVVEPATNTD